MGRNKYFNLLLFFIILNGKAVIGAQSYSLTLENSIERALAGSINLQKSAIDLEFAHYRSERVWSELFPSFSLRGSLTFLPDTALFTDPGFSYNTNNTSYSVSFGISMQFNAGIPYSMMLTELAYRRGLLDYENARNRVVLDITKIFYNLLASQTNIHNLEKTLDLAELQLEKNRIARENGLIGELPWLQSSLSAETARYNLSSALGSFEITLKDFLTTLGMDRDSEVVLEGSIVPLELKPDPEKLILEYLPRRPDIIAQRQVIERLELTAKQGDLSSKAPSLSLSAGWSGGPQRNSGISGKFTDSLSGSITLSIPIDPWIPGTRTNQNLQSSYNEIEKARLDLVNTETTAKSQIRSYCENLRNSWRNIEIARMRADIAQRTYELSEAGFQSGVVEFLSLESTRNEFADAQYRLLQSELSYLNIVLDLASTLNVDWETLTRSGE